MKKIHLFASLLLFGINCVLSTTSCEYTSAQKPYCATAKPTSVDAAQCAYQFEREQNRKELEKAKSFLRQANQAKKEVKPTRNYGKKKP